MSDQLVSGGAAGAADTAEARLAAWADDIIIGRTHVPHYANPGELKDDVRSVLAALSALAVRVEAAERERDEWKGAYESAASNNLDIASSITGWHKRAADAEARAVAAERERDAAHATYTKRYDEYKAERLRRDAAEARLQAATDALLGLRCETSLSGKPWSHHDGDPCWCGALSGHSPECLAARAVLVGGDTAHE